MTQSHTDDPTAQRAAWLQAARAAYVRAPSRAPEWLAAAEPVWREVATTPLGSDLDVDLGIYFCELCTECRRYPLMWPATDVLAAWCEQGAAPARRLFVQTLRARAMTAQGKLVEALPIVESTLAAARLVKDPLGQAYALFSLAQIALRQGDAGLAIEHAGKALECFRASTYDGPWAHAYAFLAVAMRGQASPAERRRLLAEGIEANLASFREVEAANLGLECIEIDLQEGQLEAARERLASLRERTAGLAAHEQIRVGVQLAACSVQFASGDHEGAILAAQRWLETVRASLQPVDEAYFLDRLAQWLVRAGRAEEGVQTLRRSHDVATAALREVSHQSLQSQRRAIEFEHERALRLQGELHLAELSKTHQQLQQAMQRLEASQQQLVDQAKFVALGRMLTGMAHELNTPLGVALTASTDAAQAVDQLLPDLEAGTIKRSTLIQTLQHLRRSHRLTVDNLQRTQGLLERYRDLPRRALSEPASAVVLSQLVAAAWQRLGLEAEGHRLEAIDCERTVRLSAGALTEVLLQLFRNALRHAYAPGQAGVVRVRASGTDAQGLALCVEDDGRGMEAARIPSLFEPFAARPWGQDAGGLGLYAVRVVVTHTLGGSVSVESAPGQGCRVRLVLPLQGLKAP